MAASVTSVSVEMTNHKVKGNYQSFSRNTEKMSNEMLPVPVLFFTLFWLDFPIWFQTYLIVSSTCAHVHSFNIDGL